MRRKISLYIADNLVDIDEQNLVLFNYAMEDLSNPTIVKNSYSQQVTLPATPNNNKIFGCYFRLDRVTGNGFNVLVRTPFKIYNGLNEIIAAGYCKLDSVQSNGRNVFSYSVSLFGDLGGFFYDLSTREDGTTSNLGDLAYRDRNGNLVTPNDETMELTAENIHLFWLTLENGGTGIFNADWYNFLNFAPCLNGIPADFDAKKVLVTSGYYRGISPSGGSANDRPHPDAGNAYLVTMGSDKTEDDMRDYRAYLQRPVINVSSFLDALVDRGGFFVSQGVRDMLGDSLWVTLPLPARYDDYTSYPVSKMFDGSMTPADLIISLAKRFGLVFETLFDGIHLQTRDEFYTAADMIDIERRIDRSSIKITPMNLSNKWYIWQDEVTGEFADSYRKEWNKTYGEQKVNTGYEFDAGTKIVTDTLKTRGAVQVLDNSLMYFASWNAVGEYLSASLMENLTFQGFSATGNESSSISVPDFLRDWVQTEYYNEDKPGYNVMSKPQFYGEGRKPVDGSGVLLYLDGFESVPNGGTTAGGYARMIWHLTDDDQDIYDLLNGGKPCWDMRRNVGVDFNSYPHFSRWKGSDSLEFGTPMELADPLPSYPSNTIYERCWKTYIADRYDKDTSVVSVKVDLKGMKVGQGLLKNFYWFDGSVWVLNKVNNYSLTTFDPVECEFVRVQDMDNYQNGQS